MLMRLTMDWRRWVATLCVALIAFVMVEQMNVADACHPAGQPVSYNISSTANISVADTDADSAALEMNLAHHCCCAHPVGLPTLADADKLAANAVSASFDGKDRFAPPGAPDGLERPPRPTAIA